MTSTILVDSRESRSGVPDLLRGCPGLIVNVVELQVGDYVIGEVGVDSDFHSSIADGRLMAQSRLLRANYPSAALVIEGDIYAPQAGYRPEVLQASLAAMIRIGVSIIPSKDVHDTAQILMALARQTPLDDATLRVMKPKDDEGLLKLYLVEGLPGVGPAAPATSCATSAPCRRSSRLRSRSGPPSPG